MKPFSLWLAIILLFSSACTLQNRNATSIPGSALMQGGDINTRNRTLTVLAAASLTESFTELGELFQEQNPGVAVTYNFGGSQALAEQINQGAPVDVFASASKKYMDAVIKSKRVNADDSKVFVLNRLAVVRPNTNPGGVAELIDLAKPGIKLVLADKSVPVGQYSLGFLDKANLDADFSPTYKDEVLKNVVSYEDSVKAVLTKVVLGEADAGIVYVTDITSEAAEKVSIIDIPDALNTRVEYPIASIVDSKNADLASVFIDLVMSPEGQQVMAKYGFSPVK